MMIRNNLNATLLFCLLSGLFGISLTSHAYDKQTGATGDHHAKAGDILAGKITDIIDVPNYTYAEVDTGKEKVWVAGPTTPLKVGDKISFSTGMPIKNYKSKTIDREFSLVYFVGSFVTGNEITNHKGTNLSSLHSQLKQTSKPVKGVEKVEGGNTIAEIHKQKDNLNGKTIRVRGQVTKYNAKIMGKNWLHIKDSSSSDDLTVTTKGQAAIGDVVIIEGKLMLNKDYGYGYIYPVILEDANITKQ